MGENGLLAPHRVGRAESKPHDGTIVTNKVNEMWGTDMTQTITVAEGRAYVFVAVEHANSEVVGIHAARSANRFEALEPVRQGVHRCFGSIAPGVARGLMLRHDHGSNYMSGDFQEEIECLGIEASPSFVREPQGNGVAERFIPDLTWGRSGQGGRIRVTSADLQYLFGIQRSEPDCMTRLVSEHDQPHIRSPRETAAPISRLRRSGLRKTRPFLKTGF
jgi:transposase InsO family protein